MNDMQKLMNSPQPFLADGGMETWMFFIEGFEAPEFSALMLMENDQAREKLRAYYERFLGLAQDAGTGYILDTNTWRGCVEWAPKLGVTTDELLRLSRNAVRFAHDLRSAWSGKVDPIFVNGVVGPAGDGYSAAEAPDADAAENMHAPQIRVFADEGVDLVSAITITNSAEAIGIARGAVKHDLPAIISFTVETDSRLPSGETLSEAIAATDSATDGSPLFYMINCAHPEHFRDALANDEKWISRIGGIRANASRKSHEELDQSETLDIGNPMEFGDLYGELRHMLPDLRIVGGCCGTDHRHMECVTHRLYQKNAA